MQKPDMATVGTHMHRIHHVNKKNMFDHVWLSWSNSERDLGVLFKLS